MADHLIHCYSCSGKMTVSDEHAGMVLTCPHCSVEFEVESGGQPDREPGENAPLDAPEKVPFFGFQRRKEFAKHLEHLAADGNISESDKRHLEKLASDLGVSHSEIREAQEGLFESRWKPIKSRIERAFYVTDDDLAEIKELGRRYNVSMEFDPTINFARRRWLMDTKGELPAPMPNPSIMLSGRELAYWEIATAWSQLRSVRKGYTGGAVSFRVAKGVRFSVGKAVPITSEELTRLDTGTLTFTNRKLVFQGGMRSTSVQLAKIIDLEVFKDGLMVHKDRGKSDFFATSTANATFAKSLIAALVGAP